MAGPDRRLADVIFARPGILYRVRRGWCGASEVGCGKERWKCRSFDSAVERFAPNDRRISPMGSIALKPVILAVTRIRESIAQDDRLF